MQVQSNSLTVGLFGTCGGSAWRAPFIAEYSRRGIPFFNPQVEDWKPELAELEAWHLANDSLLLFPVTSETYGTGSLSETGFSVLSALRWDTQRFFVVFIDPCVSPVLEAQNPVAAKESVRARKLVKAHLEKVGHPNVFVVSSLEDMLDVSLRLFAALQLIASVKNPAINWR